MKKKYESRIGIDVRPSKHIVYDAGKLCQTIGYFCYHQLKHIDPNKLPYIYIEIDTEYAERIKQCGETATWGKNTILIALSTKNIREDSENGFHYGCCSKSLFHFFYMSSTTF